MMRDNNQRNQRSFRPREPKEFDEKVVQVNRVSKKTKGGNKMGFSVLMVVGNKKGKVGVGMGKAKDVATAVQKATKKAKRHMLDVPMHGSTIPFAVNVKLGAAHILLKPAPPGSGIIAGGAVRAVVDAAGIRDISSKIKGTSNKASNVHATLEALRQIRVLVDTKGIKLKSTAQVEEEEKLALREQMEKENTRKAEEKARTQVQQKSAQVKVQAQPQAKPVIKPAQKKVEAPVAATKVATQVAKKK
jgi:small subunit ribosomal protein S5